MERKKEFGEAGTVNALSETQPTAVQKPDRKLKERKDESQDTEKRV